MQAELHASIPSLNFPTPLHHQNNNNETTLVLIQLIKHLKVPVTAGTARQTIEAHPDYPSLLSISDSLMKWSIDSKAIHVEPFQLQELPVPFIAHLNNSNSGFTVVTQIGYTYINHLAPSGKPLQTHTAAFIKEWSGIVLLVEANEQSGEKDFKKKIRTEKMQKVGIPFILACCFLVFLCFELLYLKFSRLAVYLTILSTLKLIGSAITFLLLWHELDSSNPLLKRICKTNKNTNCDAVLHSRHARLFNWISWSEIGFFYFTGAGIFLFCSVHSPLSAFPLLSWMNLIVLPYTAFSIYYQWKVIKQWCPLCLTVQGLLLLEFLNCYLGYWSTDLNASIEPVNLFYLFSSFIIPVIGWLLLKPLLIKSQASTEYKNQLNRLKYNKELFFSLLTAQKRVAPPKGLGILLGNPGASHNLIKVCNPYCTPCSRAHPILEELLEHSDTNLQIIFNATTNEEDRRAKPARHLLAIYENNKNLIHQALGDWYLSEEKDYDLFAAKYTYTGDTLLHDNQLNAMHKWCKEIKIEFTPAFFLDGYQLPDWYQVEDLKYLLD